MTTAVPERTRSFPSHLDPQRRRDGDGILDCVHCGLCLPSCPTYLTTGVEMASPRGRIYLMRAVREGQAGISADFVKHLDQCLGCLACEEACPSGVPYRHLLEGARAGIEARYERPTADRGWRWLVRSLFPYPERFRWVLGALYYYQRLGVSRLIRASGVLPFVSARLARMESLLPDVPSPSERRPVPVVTPAVGQRRGRVGLLAGCAQRFLLPGINRASVRVLAAAGYEVVVPSHQGCCGALHLHSGHVETAQEFARALIATFDGAGVDLVAVNAAGCGAAMKSYGDLFRGDPTWEERGTAFGATVRDISEILAGVSFPGRMQPVPLTATYHDACHLAHAQRIRTDPRALLRKIPGLRLAELPEADLCCGSAGVYNLLQPDMASQLLQRKVARIRETGASLVTAGNVGCLLQIRAGLQQAGLSVRAVHPVEVLDWSLHGMPEGALRA